MRRRPRDTAPTTTTPQAPTTPDGPETVAFRITIRSRDGVRALSLLIRTRGIPYGQRRNVATNKTIDLVVTAALLQAVGELKHYGTFSPEPTEAMLATPAQTAAPAATKS